MYIYRCLWVSPNREERVGNLYKNVRPIRAQIVKIYKKIYNIQYTRQVNPAADRANIHCKVSPALYRRFSYIAGQASRFEPVRLNRVVRSE